MSNEMMSVNPNLQSILKDVVEKHPMPGRHSYFQLKYFILHKEPTIQAKLWQCLREMKARKETLEGMALERENIRDRIGLAQLMLERLRGPIAASDEIEMKERNIKIRQTERHIQSMEKSLCELQERQTNTEEETVFFIKAFEDLENIEKMKMFDDPKAQMEYWAARFSTEMNMKLMLENRIDVELAKAILAMPDESFVKKELLGLLTKQQMAIEANQRKMTEANG